MRKFPEISTKAVSHSSVCVERQGTGISSPTTTLQHAFNSTIRCLLGVVGSERKHIVDGSSTAGGATLVSSGTQQAVFPLREKQSPESMLRFSQNDNKQTSLDCFVSHTGYIAFVHGIIPRESAGTKMQHNQNLSYSTSNKVGNMNMTCPHAKRCLNLSISKDVRRTSTVPRQGFRHARAWPITMPSV